MGWGFCADQKKEWAQAHGQAHNDQRSETIILLGQWPISVLQGGRHSTAVELSLKETNTSSYTLGRLPGLARRVQATKATQGSVIALREDTIRRQQGSLTSWEISVSFALLSITKILEQKSPPRMNREGHEWLVTESP